MEAMLPFFRESFANPNSISGNARCASQAIRTARRQIANLVDGDPANVVFTSGATESINLALQGWVAHEAARRPVSIVHSPVEHKAVLNTLSALTRRSAARAFPLHVDRLGRVSLDEIEEQCRTGADLLVLMKANNEVGNIYPVEEAAQIARSYGVPLLSDVTQAVGWLKAKEPLYGGQMVVISAHKFGGPKGIGALVHDGRQGLAPIFFGGDGRDLRPGTPNVPGIVGFGAAASLTCEGRETTASRVKGLRDLLQKALLAAHPSAKVNGDQANRLPMNLNISFVGLPNDALLARLQDKVTFSLGSACSASESGPSHVLAAMALATDRVTSAVRFGLTRETTGDDIKAAGRYLSDEIAALRQLLG